MADPQGIIYYSGIKSLLSGSFTLSHGISPSQATIYIAPQPGFLPKQGPLEFVYGSTRITFRDCVLDKMSAEQDAGGNEVWALTVVDRRWKWRHTGRISGYYNVHRGTTDIISDTEKSPRELARLCLEAMGEARFDLSQLPNDARPEIEWDYTNPAEALAQLCESLGCRVVLRLNDTVAIVRTGVGQKLPLDGTYLSGGLELDSPEYPDEIVIASNHIRWQVDLTLEAVGLDLNGDILPIDELSYKPTGGWGKVDLPKMNGVANSRGKFKTARELARETVFRWYRVKAPVNLAGIKEDITDLDRILPIGDRQIDKTKVDGREEPKRAEVFGVFYGGYECRKPLMDDVPEDEAALKALKARAKTNDTGIYTKSFSIDREKGIVMFGEPIYIHENINTTTPSLKPAVIALSTTVSLRDAKTRGWMRREFKQSLSGKKSGSKPRYIVKDDVDFHWISQTSNNLDEATKAARYYLEAAMREYKWKDPMSVSYAGFRRLDLDGAIQQVTWSIDGKGFATTRASRNREDLLVAPSYDEKRLWERQAAFNKFQRDFATASARQAKLDRGRA